MEAERPRGRETPSARVETDLRRRIAAGEWGPGERLPSVAQLAEEYETSRASVAKALGRMGEAGLVEVVPNWGTFRAEA
ncbi:GntR family transcriptional regulator [Trebonia kvetii]|uniref:GntR family transcriptional regulator n=1 Tax=Trebonia kvetii TaxID=2480626 RepID=A0A6P2C0Y1_9ACTN|nr:GntR family transcriptional regulator [Trebonia kvetii]